MHMTRCVRLHVKSVRACVRACGCGCVVVVPWGQLWQGGRLCGGWGQLWEEGAGSVTRCRRALQWAGVSRPGTLWPGASVEQPRRPPLLHAL